MKRKDFEWLTDEFMLYCRSTQLRKITFDVQSISTRTRKHMKYFILDREYGIYLEVTYGDIKEYRHVQALYHSTHC